MDRTIRLVLSAACVIVMHGGCVAPSSVRVEQRVTFRVTDTESGMPVDGIEIYITEEEYDRIFGEAYTTDSTGYIETIKWLFDGCSREGSFAGFRNCEELGNEDFVTGTMSTFIINSDADTEIIRMEIETGNRQVHPQYTIEVVGITEPEFKYTS
jgi:hypothetical protein